MLSDARAESDRKLLLNHLRQAYFRRRRSLFTRRLAVVSVLVAAAVVLSGWKQEISQRRQDTTGIFEKETTQSARPELAVMLRERGP